MAHVRHGPHVARQRSRSRHRVAAAGATAVPDSARWPSATVGGLSGAPHPSWKVLWECNRCTFAKQFDAYQWA